MRAKNNGSEPMVRCPRDRGESVKGGTPLSQNSYSPSELAAVRRRRTREFRSPTRSVGRTLDGARTNQDGRSTTRSTQWPPPGFQAVPALLLSRRCAFRRPVGQRCRSEGRAAFPERAKNNGSEPMVRCPRDRGESVKGGTPPFTKTTTPDRNSPKRAIGARGSFDRRRAASGGSGTGGHKPLDPTSLGRSACCPPSPERSAWVPGGGIEPPTQGFSVLCSTV